MKTGLPKLFPPPYFNQGKKETITVTFLDITLQDLRNSGLIQEYRNEHNRNKHYFSENGRIETWVPKQKMEHFLSEQTGTVTFSPGQVQQYLKYGFDKITATVSKNRIIRYARQDYYVTIGADLFSRHKSTPVKISSYRDKLYIFELKEDGVLLGEALACKPFDGPPVIRDISTQPDEVSQMIDFLEKRSMIVDRPAIIEMYHRGIDLKQAKTIYLQHQQRYDTYMKKIRQPQQQKGKALFNAFALDCHKSMHAAGSISILQIIIQIIIDYFYLIVQNYLKFYPTLNIENCLFDARNVRSIMVLPFFSGFHDDHML